MNLLMKPLTVSRLANWLEKTFCHHIDVFCEEEVPEYVQQDCGVENGGIVAIGLILSSTYVGEDGNDTEKRTNLESSTWWEDAINASPQGAWVVLQTRGSKAAGTPVEEEGFGLNSVERTGDDQEIVFEALGFLDRSEEHTSELQSREKLVCRLLLEKKKMSET